MALLTLVVVPAKVKKGGKHNIRISIAHNGQTRYIVTDVVIDSIKEWRNGQVVGRPDANFLNTMLHKKLVEYERILSEQYYIEGLTCAQLVTAMKDYCRVKNMTVEGIFKEMVEVSNITRSSKSNYMTICRSVTKFFGKDKTMQSLRNVEILKFVNHLKASGKSQSTIRQNIAIFSCAYTFAQRNEYVKCDRSPFEGLKLPPTTIDDNWASIEELRMIRDHKTKRPKMRKRIQKCIDIFMLSYYLGGINLNDLKKIDFRGMEHTMTYTRSKVQTRWNHKNDMLSFDMPPEAWTIIQTYMKPNGKLRIAERMDIRISNNLTRVCEDLGIRRMTMKTARKSFAQHAFDLGISDRIIDRVLGHIPERRGSVMHHYIMVTDKMVNDCIRRVIDNLNADKKDSYSFAAIGASSNI